MSINFIGLTMLVTLTSPLNTQFRGTVSGIEPGKSLTLRNVSCLATGNYMAEITIKASEIQEVVEAPDSATPAYVTQTGGLEDPAILSLAKCPTLIERPLIPSSIPPEEKILASSGPKNLSNSPEVVLAELMATNSVNEGHKENKAAAASESSQDNQEVCQPAKTENSNKRRQEKRENKTPRNRGRKGWKLDEDIDHGVTAEYPKSVAGSKNWKQTQSAEGHPSFQPFSILKKKGLSREDEGWATGGATDVKGLGDFDFEGGLAKFDKNTIFNQLQAEDSVGEEDRLVFHNRLPKAKSGTAGGKNLHFSENVLGQPKHSKESPTARKGSWDEKQVDVSDDTEVSQQNSTDGCPILRTERSSSIPEDSDANISTFPPRSFSILRVASYPAFFTVPSGHRCESVSPAQMFNLESIADSELGLSEDMMAENSGRGVAEVAFSVCKAAWKRPTKAENTPQHTAVVLAGNNKNGLRAISAARHMQNHGIHIIACVLGLERESELLVGLKRQIKVFQSFGGQTLTQLQFFEFIKHSDVCVDLIIDGLLGLTVSFEELRTEDQSIAYELISWANNTKASVLAIDIPTGIDPTTGKTSIIDGRQLHLHAEYIVAMGAPKKGLLEAMSLGLGFSGNDGQQKGQEWQLFVADIGLGAAVWTKAGTKVRRGIEFEGNWVLPMRYQAVISS